MKYKLDSACAYCPDCNRGGQDSWELICDACNEPSLVQGFRYIDLVNLKYVYSDAPPQEILVL
jgi:hypothetical protein